MNFNPIIAATNILFAGEQFDPQLGQYYQRARIYDPATGRFTQRDSVLGSLQMPQTLHKYGYALQDPINYTDPSGNGPVSARLGIAVHNAIGTHFIASAPGRRANGALSTLGAFIEGYTSSFPLAFLPTLGLELAVYLLPEEMLRLRPDLLDVILGSVYEIKPNNNRQISIGIRQLKNYVLQLNMSTIEKTTGLPSPLLPWHRGSLLEYDATMIALAVAISGRKITIEQPQDPARIGLILYDNSEAVRADFAAILASSRRSTTVLQHPGRGGRLCPTTPNPMAAPSAAVRPASKRGARPGLIAIRRLVGLTAVRATLFSR